MTRTCLALAAVTLHIGVLGLEGCKTKTSPPIQAKADPPAAPSSPDTDESALPPNARLALQKLNGATAADKAVEEAQGNVRQQLTKDDAWVVLGRAWVRKARESNDPGFYLNADACAGFVLDRSPDHVLALDLRGLVLLNGHRFAEAEELAGKIIAEHPQDPMAWGIASDALLEMGRYEQATKAAQKMVDLKPNLPSYSRASHVQWLYGDVANAKQTVRLALDAGRDVTRDPEPRAWVLVQAAMLFWHQGDYDGAEAGFDKALERIDDYAPANVGKGRVAMARGDFKRAAELFERALKVSPLVETAWLLHDAREALGDSAGAAEASARVEREGLRTDPRTLSMFLSTTNTKVDEALRLAREEYAIRQDVVTEDALAWALYRNGKIDEAKASILRARRLGTPDARLVYHEGAIRIAAGEVKKGRELVLSARKMNRAFDATAGKEIEALVM